MNTLIITANPSSKWFTHKIAEKIIENINKNKENFEIIDLYKTNLKQDFLNYEDKKEIWWFTKLAENLSENTIKIQEKISLADEIIFIFPIWWWDMPAIMKNFWDNNFLSGFAFKYEKNWNKIKRIWLLKWKTARVIATSWAPGFFYNLILHIQFMWNLNRISFCWIKLKSFTIFWDMDRSKVNKNNYLKKVEKLFSKS